MLNLDSARSRRGDLRKPASRKGNRESAKRLAAQELLRQARSFRPHLAALDRSARDYHKLLEAEVSLAEIEAMATPAAELLGSLECLLNSDLEPVSQKLDELEELLVEPPRRSGRGVRPRRKKTAGRGKTQRTRR